MLSNLLKLGEEMDANIAKYGKSVRIEEEGQATVDIKVESVVFGPRDTKIGFETSTCGVKVFSSTPDTQFESREGVISFISEEGKRVSIFWERMV
jgi:hypothetical protein